MNISISVFVLAALVLTGCSTNDSPSSPGTTLPPLSGTLIYEKEGNGIHEYSFDAKTDKVLISDGFEPQQTAAGELLHLIGKVAGTGYTVTGKIGLLNSAHTQRTVLLDGSDETLGEPQMSADGRYFAFSWVGRPGSPLYSGPSGVIIVRQSDGHKIIADSLSHPAWTPDGRLVMDGNFQYRDGSQIRQGQRANPGLYMTDTALKNVFLFLPGSTSGVPAQPNVSPDGTRIAYIQSGSLYTVQIDGTGVRRLTSAAIVQYPVWSPDGKWIAVNGMLHNLSNADSASAVAVIPSDVSSPVLLADESPYWVITPESKILETDKQMSWR